MRAAPQHGGTMAGDLRLGEIDFSPASVEY